MKLRSKEPKRRWTASALFLCFAVLMLVTLSVVAASCGGSGSATTTAGPATTESPATTAGGTPSTTVGGGASGAQVVMKNFAFDPPTVTIKVGESVTWTNQDSVSHTVDADNGEFTSNDLANGATFSFTFDKAGSYPYHCSIHPTMKGTVVVQ